MVRPSALPASAVIIETYEELREYLRAFAAGKLSLLIVLGRPGPGKSHTARQTLRDKATFLSGNTTPFGLYCELFEHRDKLIVLDDIDGLSSNQPAIRLLKELCQSEPRKTVSWNSDRTQKSSTIPRQFITRSRVMIIANEWRSLGVDVAALEDRGHIVVFDPPAIEVHREAAKWFWDQEIHDFIGQHLGHFRDHSSRTYPRVLELKESEMDWRGKILARCLSKPELAVVELLAKPSMTEQERAQEFVAAEHGCRATYFNIKKRLGEIDTAPSMPVLGNPPTVPNDESPLDLQMILRRQFGTLGEG